MDTIWKTIIWQQFGASIDMLENALLACPDEMWGERSEQPEYWYLIYHTLFWLDLYLSGSVEGFSPPAPYTLDELDPAGVMPERVYAKEELQTYLRHCRRKCRATIESLTDEKAHQLCVFGRGEVSFAELLLYNMRHVQHHSAQLNLILRRKTNSAPGWVARAKNSHGRE
ncbi:MAG TPA: DinB family protein [Pyrinomonadaceae bacterium]